MTVINSNLGKALVLGTVLGAAAAASGSVLSQLAGSMKEGTWAELKTDGFNTGDRNLFDRCVHSMLAFSDAVQWDSVAGHLYVLGSGHGEWATGNCIGFVRYDEATNAWTTLEKPPFFANIHHSWDHTAFIPAKREIYHKTSITEQLYKYDIQTKAWTLLQNTFDANMDCRYGALEYFPDMNGLFWYREPYVYNLASKSWSKVTNPYANENQNYNVFAEYNPRLRLMLAGGGNGSKNLYQVDHQGRFTKKNAAPFSLGINSSLQFADPNTGMYIFYDMAGRKLYHYDAVEDKWIIKTEQAPLLNDYKDYQNVVGGYLNTHKVVIFLQWQGTQSKIWLYKPDQNVVKPAAVEGKRPAQGGSQMQILPEPLGRSLRIKAPMAEGNELVVRDIEGKFVKSWSGSGKNGMLDVSWERPASGKAASSQVFVFTLARKGAVLQSRTAVLY